MEKNKLMMTIIIVLLVVLLLSIGGVAFVVVRMLSAQNPVVEETGQTNPVKKELSASEIEYVKFTDAVSVNLADSPDGSSHAVSVKFDVGIDNTDKKNSADFITLVGLQKTVVKDAVIGILRSKTIEEMKKPDTQELLKQELVDKLQQEFDSDLIYNVKFDIFYYD